MVDQIKKRKAIRALDEQFHKVHPHDMLSQTARQYINLEKRPKDFPVKRLDALDLMYMEGTMPPLGDAEPWDLELEPEHREYFELLRKIDNYET